MNRLIRLMGMALCLLTLDNPAFAQGPALENLERYLRPDVPQRQILEARRDADAARVLQREAQAGWQLSAATSLEQQRQNVVPDGVQAYNGSTLNVGASYPLLGSRTRLEQALADARLNTRLSEAQWRGYRREQLRLLRLAWLNAWTAQEKKRIAASLSGEAARAEHILSARSKARLVFESERQDALSAFADMKRLQAEAAAQAQLAGLQIARLAQLPLSALQPGSLPRPNVRQSPQPDGLDDPLQLKREAVDEFAQEKIASSTLSQVESELQLGYSRGLQSSAPDQYSSSVFVGVQVKLPAAWGGWRDGRVGERRARIAEQQLAVQVEQAQRDEQTIALQGEITKSEADSRLQVQKLRAAQRLLAEKTLRMEALPGTGYEAWLQARTRLATVELDQLLSWQRLQEWHIELAALSGCALLAADTQPENRSMRAEVGLSAPAEKPARGVYVWEIEALLNAPNKEIPRLQAHGINRVLLSLNAPQVRDLPKTRARLRPLLDELHAASMQVELVFAEPTWMYPKQRPGLLKLLNDLQGLPFDGIHLDLEVEQLPEWQKSPARAQRWWLETVNAVAEATALPLGLSMHYRHLAAPAVMQALRASKLKRLAIMAYVTRPARQLEIMRQAVQVFPGRGLDLALSIEASLPPENSYATRPSELFIDFARLSAPLDPSPGLLIQSWEELSRALP